MPNRFPSISLQFVKKIIVQFSPWEPNVRSARSFLSVVGSISARKTNPDCKVQTIVKNDGAPPEIAVDFLDGKRLMFKTTNLTAVNILQKFHSWHKTRLAALGPEEKKDETKKEATKQGGKR